MDNLEFTHRVYHPVSAFYVYFAESFGGSGSLYCPPQLTGLNPALRPIIRGRATCIVCGVRLTPGLHTVQILRRRMRRPDSHAQGHVFLSPSSTAGAGIERRVTRVPRGALQRPCPPSQWGIRRWMPASPAQWRLRPPEAALDHSATRAHSHSRMWHAKGAFSGLASHRRPLFPHSAQFALLSLSQPENAKVHGHHPGSQGPAPPKSWFRPFISLPPCRPPAEVLRFCAGGASHPELVALWRLQSARVRVVVV